MRAITVSPLVAGRWEEETKAGVAWEVYFDLSPPKIPLILARPPRDRFHLWILSRSLSLKRTSEVMKSTGKSGL
jgi:hypothetical protein